MFGVGSCVTESSVPVFLAEKTATTNLDMLLLYAVPQLLAGTIHQQDGAPPHFSSLIRTFLEEQFTVKLIGRGDLLEIIYAAVNNVTP